MNIETYSTVNEAKKATGMTIVIDVLRACTTIPILLNNGAKTIMPVKTIEEAEEYIEKDYILIGEGKDGTVHDSFHHCNSPSEVELIDFHGKDIVIRTNNATQAIHDAKNADEIVLASFVNLDAVVKYILKNKANRVTLLPLGRLNEKGLEDELCAEAIKTKLQGESINEKQIKDQVDSCACAKLVRDTLDKPRDVEMALEFNSYPIVPKVFIHDNRIVIKSAE